MLRSSRNGISRKKERERKRDRRDWTLIRCGINNMRNNHITHTMERDEENNRMTMIENQRCEMELIQVKQTKTTVIRRRENKNKV